MAISDKDIQIRITLNSEGVVTGIKQLNEELKEVKNEAESASGGFSSFQKNLISLQAGLGLAKEAFSVLSGVASSAIEAIKRGSDISDVAETFDQLSNSAGTTAKVFISELGRATGQTVSNFDAMRAANEALRAGIKPDEFIKLTEAARVLADQTGADLLPTIEKLSNAFETGQVKALGAALGGVIDLEQAQKKLAQQLGINISELTKEQQVYVARQSILDAATRSVEKFGKVENDAADSLAQVSAAFTNVKDEILKYLANSPEVIQSLKDIATFTSQITKEIIDKIPSAIKVIKELGNAIAFAAKLATGQLGADLGRQLGEDLGKSIFGSSDALKPLVDPNTYLGLDILTKRLSENRDANRSVAPAIALTNEQLRNQAEAIERLNSPAGIEELYNQIDRLIGIYRNKLIKINELNDAINKQEKAFTKAGGSVEVFGETVDKALGNNLSDIDGKLSETASQNVGTFESILGAVFGFQPGTTIGAQIATGAGFVANLVEKSVTTGLTKRDTGALIGAAVGAIIGGYIAAAVSFGAGTAVGAALGASVGSSIGSLIGALFTDGTPGTKKIIDKYFADIFNKDRLTVVIGDQLKVIDDLVFGKFINGFVNTANGETTVTEPFKEALAGLPEEIRASFVGVGTALSELINDTGEFGEKLAAVFLGNLENLNNLGILLRQVGASAEDLQDALLETFLSGDISAVELVTGLQGIQTALAEGIPDGIGLVEEAFNNLFAAGSKGGAALVDAIRDVAIEAKERGVNSLDALRQELLKTFDAATVDAFFQALAQNGIDSIEELGEASDITAANIAAALESAGLLADQSIKKAEEIAAKLEELETRAYETSLTIKVRTEFEDGNAQQALGQTGQSLPGIAS